MSLASPAAAAEPNRWANQAIYKNTNMKIYLPTYNLRQMGVSENILGNLRVDMLVAFIAWPGEVDRWFSSWIRIWRIPEHKLPRVYIVPSRIRNYARKIKKARAKGKLTYNFIVKLAENVGKRLLAQPAERDNSVFQQSRTQENTPEESKSKSMEEKWRQVGLQLVGPLAFGLSWSKEAERSLYSLGLVDSYLDLDDVLAYDLICLLEGGPTARQIEEYIRQLS